MFLLLAWETFNLCHSCIQYYRRPVQLYEYGYGYTDYYRFFLARSRFNESTYGWTENLGTVEEAPGDFVWTRTGEEIAILVENLKPSRGSYPRNCHYLDLSIVSELKGKRIAEFFLRFFYLEEHTIEIQLVGFHKNRFIKDHAFLSSGKIPKRETLGPVELVFKNKGRNYGHFERVKMEKRDKN